MSISVSGCASRSFIIGIRLCPPARIRASGPNLASRAIASSMLVAFSYSTYAGTCMHPPSRRGARRLECTRGRLAARPKGQAGGGVEGLAGRAAAGQADGGRRRPRPHPRTAAAAAVRDNDRAMTLTQLNAFVLVARLGSVTAAANALGVSEPAVSQALSALRLHLGDQLVSRGPSGMTLTPGGSRLLSTASQIVVLGAEAHAAVRAAQGAPEQLRVVSSSTAAEFLISPLTEAFSKRFPGSV